MSSPGASSGSSFQTPHHDGTTSSGHTTPDPHPPASAPSKSSYHQFQQAGMTTNPHHPSTHTPRRSSTPAQSFLAPRFFGQGNPYDSMVAANAHATNNAGNNTGSPAAGGPPRRTSFGTALGCRLGVLSSLGLGAGAWGSTAPSPSRPQHQNQTSQQQQQQPPPSQTSSSTTSPILKPAEVVKSKPPPQVVEKRHICVPDGCGGYVTVEERTRRPSYA